MGESDRGHEGIGDPGTVRNGNGAGPLDYDVVESLAWRAIKDSNHMEAMTFSPKSNRIYDVRCTSQALALFMEIVMNDKGANPVLPIYLVGITCHTSVKMDHAMREAYIHASRYASQPLLGTWTNSRGTKYLDIVIPVQFPEALKSDEYALELGRKYEQDVIIRIESDGNSQFLETH